MQTLRLTSNEIKQYLALPEALRNSWKAEEVQIEYKDSKDRTNARLLHLHASAPELKTIADAAVRGLSLPEMVALVEDLDLSKLPQHDVQELLYAVGPDVLGLIIQQILSFARLPEDLAQVEAYATIRALFFAPLTV